MLNIAELVIASHNQGKVREIRDLLKPHIKKFYSAADFNVPEPAETEDTFEGNAILKAEHTATITGKPALADDSGLCVNALNGNPGVLSARWGGPEKNFDIAMNRVNDALGDANDRSAYFVCVLALAIPNQKTLTFRGESHGQITWPARGDHGFGYDPIFTPDNHTKTFAEMTRDEKYTISHRTKAFEKMMTAF